MPGPLPNDVVSLWDWHDGRQVRTLAAHPTHVLALAFSPDEALLASVGWDSTIRVWNIATGMQIRAWNTHQRTVYALACSPDGLVLASGAHDGTMLFWDLHTGRQVAGPELPRRQAGNGN